ncbi:MAG: gas vesicle protein GvpD P-loop domain-containing protein [Candidatus Thorarchaeota archaeon]
MTLPPELVDNLKQEQGQTFLVKGKSGTGKTTFALSLLEVLAKELPDKFDVNNFIYLSSRVTSANLHAQFPWAFDFLPEGKIVDATPALMGVPESSMDSGGPSANRIVYSDELTFISSVNDCLRDLESPVCIIDSFDAVIEAAQADPQRLTSAITNLGRILNAKIILIVEGIEDSPLDHIVDGIICLTKSQTEGRMWRSIRLLKLRGTPIDQGMRGFSLTENRFSILHNYDTEQAFRVSDFKVIPHSGGRFSSGIRELDDIFGGFRRGSTFFIQVAEGVSNEVVNTLLMSMIANFLHQESGVVIVPPNKLSFRRLKAAALRYGFVDQLNTRLRLFASAASSLGVSSAAAELGEPYYKTVAFRESSDLENAWSMVLEELRNQGCKDLLSVIGFGWLYSWLGPAELPRWATRIANDTATESNLAVTIGYSSTPEINQYLADLADIHVELAVREGVTIFHGINPSTPQYCIYTHLKEGKPQIGFQEIA